MKGILFKPDMIQAIIEGRKTQTRRVIKPQLCDDTTFIYADGYCSLQANHGYAPYAKSRYHIGETVYIKETHCIECYKRDNYKDACFKTDEDGEALSPALIICEDANWHSPLFIPEWAARHFIVIEQVRVERVQGITIADIRAEGFDGDYTNIGYYYVFGQTWNTINPKYPWEINPWVFTYTFSLKELPK